MRAPKKPTLCPPAVLADCVPVNCRTRCALETIDELLALPRAAGPAEIDLFLEFRWHLRQRDDAEAALRLFCELRRRMEQRHYLAFFRIRRWLENNLVAVVTSKPAAQPHVAGVRLSHYCVEAIRRVCLCSALGEGARLVAPRVRFAFRPAAAPRAQDAQARRSTSLTESAQQ